MTSNLSAYLDVVRFAAACLVYLFHVGFHSGARLEGLGNFGSEAVLIFFVLSGFVIAFSINKNKVNIEDYIVSRIARLWSVMIPAIFITFILDTIGQNINGSVYEPLQPYSVFKWFASSLLNLFFLAQSWGLKISPGTNGPFWSISYEFWFYMIFSCIVFLRGRVLVFSLFLIFILTGIKFFLIFPLWYLGVFIFNKSKFFEAGNLYLGVSIWLISFALLIFYFYFKLSIYLEDAFPVIFEISKAHWRVNFLPESYILVSIIGLNIYAFSIVAVNLPIISDAAILAIRRIADSSFGIYLFHYPLIFFFKALLLFLKTKNSEIYTILMYFLPFFSSFILAVYFDKYKFIYKIYISYFARKIRFFINSINRRG